MKKWIFLFITTLILSGCAQDNKTASSPADMLPSESSTSSEAPSVTPDTEDVAPPEDLTATPEAYSEVPSEFDIAVENQDLETALYIIYSDVLQWENYVFDYTILAEGEPEVAHADAFADTAIETWLCGRSKSHLSIDETYQMHEVYMEAWNGCFTFEQRLELAKRSCSIGFESHSWIQPDIS